MLIPVVLPNCVSVRVRNATTTLPPLSPTIAQGVARFAQIVSPKDARPIITAHSTHGPDSLAIMGLWGEDTDTPLSALAQEVLYGWDAMHSIIRELIPQVTARPVPSSPATPWAGCCPTMPAPW